MNKKDVFNVELNYIKDERIRKSAENLIELLPDYFFLIPASLSGKYHPSFTLGDGGLVRHTKLVTKLAYELLQNNSTNNYTENEKDLIIVSTLLHDGLKHGMQEGKYAVDHPLIVSNYIRCHQNKTELNESEINYICGCIESHMGEWNKDYNNNEILPLPKSKQSRFVHMCDYLASRKFMNIDFDSNNNIVE